MGKLIGSTFVTLDGVIGEPQNWGGPYWDEQHSSYAQMLLDRSEALLLGRATYDVFAASWPERAGDPYADRLNAMPKYVTSTSLAEGPWTNTTVISSDVVGAVKTLKQRHDADILKFGTGALDATLVEGGLIDELHLWVFPVVAGSGELLFHGALELSHLRLLGSTVFDSGIVVHVCSPS
jgi:dihydrofolate reductase